MIVKTNPESDIGNNATSLFSRIVSAIESIDRRIIFIFVAVSLSLPLVYDVSLAPAEMKTATSFFNLVDALTPRDDQIVLIAADWGPSTKAENQPQTTVAIEHLLRKRIRFALVSNIAFASPFLKNLPNEVVKRLQAENPNEKWTYGKDWVNLGYRPGMSIMIQGLAKTSDFHAVIKTDAFGTSIGDIPMMKEIKTIKNIALLMEFTGSTGVFNAWLQFFRIDDYIPPYVHGCTSVTIPEAYMYFVSKQIVGLFEGVAGAAWYEELLSRKYPQRVHGDALRFMTSLSFAHLVIIAFVLIGNIGTIADRICRCRME